MGYDYKRMTDAADTIRDMQQRFERLENHLTRRLAALALEARTEDNKARIDELGQVTRVVQQGL